MDDDDYESGRREGYESGYDDGCESGKDEATEEYRQDALRYRWIREHGAWETEAFLNGLTPEEYDAAVDKAMAQSEAR